jgi:hypothetical protein
MAPNIRKKNAAHKESPGENSHPRAGFNGRYEVAQEEREFRPDMPFL